MMHLWEAGPQRQVDLVNVLDGDPATMARTIARLERAGFVRRTPGVVDRRTAIVEPTPAGQASRAELERLWRELEEQTLSGFDPDERATLRSC